MNVAKRIIRIFGYILGLLATFLFVLALFHSDNLIIKNYEYKNNKNNDKLSIVMLSDFHHRDLKFPNLDLIEQIKTINPNFIFFVGDMIDQYVNDLNPILNLIDGLKDYSIYYVTGNHDSISSYYDQFINELDKRSNYIHFFDDKQVDLTENIVLYGLHDPYLDSKSFSWFKKDYGKLEETINNTFTFDNSKLNILISHRPELMDMYAKYPFDIIFSGHTHNNQIRLPGIDFFSLVPGTEYSYGEHVVNNKHLYVSSGLGYSLMLPIRINCNPEIINFVIKK